MLSTWLAQKDWQHNGETIFTKVGKPVQWPMQELARDVDNS
jgi:hypothetical protein